MVKFGRHLQFYIEDEGESAHYIIPYNDLRDQVYHQSSSETDVDDDHTFEKTWRKTLELACNDFRESTSSCWKNVFESIYEEPNVRGATLNTALVLYTQTVAVSDSQDLLCFLKGIVSSAKLNSEGLRKLVKKFDKQGSPSSSLSSTLLPELYCSSVFTGIPALETTIEILRDLLDDMSRCSSSNSLRYLDDYTDDENLDYPIAEEKKTSSFSDTNILKRYPRYDSEESVIGRRANEMQWLRETVQKIPQKVLQHAVVHRGFHNPKGVSDQRPLENSLSAFEIAWTNGVHICECDIALTKDEKLVLAHDSDFKRLSLDPSSDSSNRKVSDLTFRELVALTLKNGVRAPLLLEVLRSASNIGPQAQLVVEIKPGNHQTATALARLFERYPEYMPHVAVIMSFDLWSMHQLRVALDKAFMIGNARKPTILSSSPKLPLNMPERTDLVLPKLMLLTVADTPEDHYELWVDCNDYAPVHGWLETDESRLDGVYVRYEPAMLEPSGKAELKSLCEKYSVGVYQVYGDVDNLETMSRLVKDCGVTFFNTDLPRDFL